MYLAMCSSDPRLPSGQAPPSRGWHVASTSLPITYEYYNHERKEHKGMAAGGGASCKR